MELAQDHFELSKKAIKTGSKSFRLASLLLSPKAKRGAYLLYRWCRECDDAIDEAPNLESAKRALKALYLQTQRGLDTSSPEDASAFSGLLELKEKYQIPPHYFFELLEGFKMDVEQSPILTQQHLSNYCYHVAGVVGLMMSFILQASHAKALRHADLLGRAMQLTNIARDVAADDQLGRVYLPEEALQIFGLNKINFFQRTHRAALFKVVLNQLDLADEWYRLGREGIAYLPLRAAWSISVASFLYQGIGWKVRRLGPAALDHRTVLHLGEKLQALIRGTQFFIFNRLQHWITTSTERL